MENPENHSFEVTMEYRGISSDTIDLSMPRWMPGYYQIMDYWKGVSEFSATGKNRSDVTIIRPDSSTWRIATNKNNTLTIKYKVFSNRRFVANNYLDTTRAYIVPAATFMYPEGRTDIPVTLNVMPYHLWKDIATGLEKAEGSVNRFLAPDFDILYDCPILIGNLEELPSFEIGGIKHRFIACQPGEFDHDTFIAKLEKTIKAGTEIIGDIPYSEYTFIGIGPGAGGIEHLNNTTVSLSGSRLDNPESAKGTLKFLAHEYFHNYNVKRIRPYELGPFDYSKEARTNLLWVSEGFTVYYEYLMVRRAGVIDSMELIESLEGNISAYENDPGKDYQSLVQASFDTWRDGPFGSSVPGQDRSISVYDKGAVIAFIFDLTIRNATGNERSLDDVMRYLYDTYYKHYGRGFTDAEFREACEMTAGTSMSDEFEYVYSTTYIDYSRYLSYAGLTISVEKDSQRDRDRYTISRVAEPSELQSLIYDSWARQSDY
ncbi:MAG: M61 family metallopeptidase [Bacteroidales bacterium]|nr:M61 family metallopeptidase [Bacteroidales bacterium]